ncbi:down syndrome cell adhesion molecule [Trichonephila clavipes]|nr:down syndrome cell adhesion molecule [Trichonephila clavipes]
MDVLTSIPEKTLSTSQYLSLDQLTYTEDELIKHLRQSGFGPLRTLGPPRCGGVRYATDLVNPEDRSTRKTTAVRKVSLMVFYLFNVAGNEQTSLSRLISRHVRSLTYSNDIKIFPICSKCCNIQATPKLILNYMRLDTQDTYSSQDLYISQNQNRSPKPVIASAHARRQIIMHTPFVAACRQIANNKNQLGYLELLVDLGIPFEHSQFTMPSQSHKTQIMVFFGWRPVAAHFKTPFHVHRVSKGDSLSIQCEAIGENPIKIEWSKDKVVLNSNTDTRYNIKDELTSKGKISTLAVSIPDRRDSALFSCTAINAFGKDDTNIQVLVEAYELGSSAAAQIAVAHTVVEDSLPESRLVLAETGRHVRDFRLTLYKRSDDLNLQDKQSIFYLTRVY